MHSKGWKIVKTGLKEEHLMNLLKNMKNVMYIIVCFLKKIKLRNVLFIHLDYIQLLVSTTV